MKKWGTVLLLMVQTFVLCSVTVFCVVPFSCKVSEEGIILVGGDYTSPYLEEVCVLDDKTVTMAFSEKVKLKSYIVSKKIEDISDSSEHSETKELSPALMAAAGGYGTIETDYSISEDGCIITYTAASSYEIGQAYEIFGTVEDKAGNTLTFCVPFCGYNSKLPKLVMTEVQVKYKKYKEDAYRCEFVELLALTDGNLCGLELVSGVDGDSKKYVFPPVDVEAGEVFVVHLRSMGSGCVTEEEDLNESTAVYSGKNVRDIWADNSKARLSDNSDIIVIRNSINGELLDAFMYAVEGAPEWDKNLAVLAEAVEESGIYEDVSVSEVELNVGLGTVAAKSFCRGDAKELCERARAGEFLDETAEYPVKRIAENWTVKNVTPGTL